MSQSRAIASQSPKCANLAHREPTGQVAFFTAYFHHPTDTQEDLIPWDYPEDSSADLTIEGRSILLDRSVSVGSLVLKDGAKLVFKDFGEESDFVVTLRAKSVQIIGDGELWIGSRSCRYQGKR